MPGNIVKLPDPSPAGEKRGNSTWIECDTCGNWFHTTVDLIARESVALHCPQCHAEFVPAAARRIVLA